jgi:hypothetical protein
MLKVRIIPEVRTPVILIPVISLAVVFVVLTDRFDTLAAAVILLLFASVFALALSLPQAAASLRRPTHIRVREDQTARLRW